jgi:hypothetical protein
VVHLETDASMVGWGAVMYKGTEFKMWEGTFGGVFDKVPIHIKEMWAVQRALEALAGDINGYCIDLYTDNMVVQHALLRGSLVVPDWQLGKSSRSNCCSISWIITSL